jgi:micrococcal nuclease
MKRKALLNLLPAVALLIGAGNLAYQQWQQIQAARPNYDNPAATQPHGTVNGAEEIEVPQSETWQVVRVTDGDTLVAERKGKQEKIRFCGIDAPEQAQPLGDQATAYLQGLVDQAQGKITIVPVERDRYGRMVAEVFVLGNEEKFVQTEMLQSGMAYIYPQYVNRCWNNLSMKAAEVIGQEQKAGVWAGDYQRPWDYRKQS